MDWLQELDRQLFCFINQTWSNPVFDQVMPFLSGNILFVPGVVVAGVWLIWKHRLRGALCVLMLALIVWPGDTFIANKLKKAIGRPRPYLVVPDTRLPDGIKGNADERPSDGSVLAVTAPGGRLRPGMPSSHGANWGAATMILFVYFRRSLWIALPLGGAVCYSRVYNGVHYPADVLAGWLLGAGYAAVLVFAIDAAWRRLGKAWFTRQRAWLPSLILSRPAAATASERKPPMAPQTST